MIVLYNKHTRDYYLVTGLNEGISADYLLSDKKRNVAGDFIIISSGRQSNTPAITTSGFSFGFSFLKKVTLILFLISLIPFSSVMATGYMHLLNERKAG
jgi:hypothetical protein